MNIDPLTTATSRTMATEPYHTLRFVLLIFLLLPLAAPAQTRMVLEHLEKEKKVFIDTGDFVQVQFLSDSVLQRRYRPWGYRRKDKRVSYVQAKVIGYTDQGFAMVPRRRFLGRLLGRPVDTMIVNVGDVMAINKTNAFKLFGTSVLAQAAVRGTTFVVLTATGNFWVFMGLNVAGLVLSPFTRKYVRNVATPLRKVPEKLADWELYLSYAPDSAPPE